MARLFIVGTGPLLEAGARVMSGQCLRTWHFTAPLREDGHEVCLYTVPIPGATRDEAEPPVEEASYQGFPYRRLLSNDPARTLPLLRRAIEDFAPDALVGVNAHPAWLLCRTGSGKPLWADLNGWTMAEGRVRAAVLGHDRDYAHFWKLEARTLLRADRFSTVTERQADALYGELAMIGRLTRHGFTEEIAHAVANAIHPDYTALQRRPGAAHLPAPLREGLPPSAILCLWSGGFNSWTNLDLFLGSLEEAMRAEPSLHLVCTGGAIHGHDEATYARFLEGARARLPEGRWKALGWVDLPDVLALHQSAHMGLNVDGLNTETRFGARNRLTNMLGAGLPVVTTRGTEIAEWIGREDLGAVVDGSESGSLTAALVEGARAHAAWEERAARARTRACAAFAPRATLAAFLRWAADPRHAADHGAADDDPAERLRRWVLETSEQDFPFAFDRPRGQSHGMASPSPPPSLMQRIRQRLRRRRA